MKKLVLLCLLALALPVLAIGPRAGKHTLTWTPSPSYSVSGYWLYWRAPLGSYNDANRVGISTNTTTFNLDSLGVVAGDWVLAMSSTNDFGSESPLSVECPWNNKIPDPPTGLKVVNP